MTACKYNINYCVVIVLNETNKTEMARWRWYALAITLLGIIIFSLPWIPSKIKFFLTIPLYAVFVYVYYRYICLKKAAKSALSSKDDDPGDQKILPEQNLNKKARKTVKSPAKKG